MAAILKMAAILSAIMKQKWKFRFNGFLNMDIDTKNLKDSQCSEVWDSKLWYVVFQGGHFENGRHFVRHFEFSLDNDIFQNSWVFWASVPKFMLVSLNARFLWKIDLISLANIVKEKHSIKH